LINLAIGLFTLAIQSYHLDVAARMTMPAGETMPSPHGEDVTTW
jgi:hypothetical protein